MEIQEAECTNVQASRSTGKHNHLALLIAFLLPPPFPVFLSLSHSLIVARARTQTHAVCTIAAGVPDMQRGTKRQRNKKRGQELRTSSQEVRLGEGTKEGRKEGGREGRSTGTALTYVDGRDDVSACSKTRLLSAPLPPPATHPPAVSLSPLLFLSASMRLLPLTPFCSTLSFMLCL